MTSSAINGIDSVSSWFTPTVLFCIVNLVIVTIFMLNPHKKQPNLTEEDEHQHHQPKQLVRVPSLLDRVKSFKLSKYGSDSRPDPVENRAIEAAEEEHQHQPKQLVRVPSLLDRVKSFKISKYVSDSRPDPVENRAIEAAEEESARDEINHVKRSKSDNKEKSEVKPTSIVRLLKKSFSEKFTARVEAEAEEEVGDHRPATVREKTAAFNGEDEAVDEKADDFINRFRQQLKLQRLDSILRYREMVNRGAER